MAFLPPLKLTSRPPTSLLTLSQSYARRAHRVDTPRSRRVQPRCGAREVSAEELETVLKENARPLLVDAYAPWCGPCQFLLPQLDIISDKYESRLDVVKLDTEEYRDLASALMIRGLPTLFFIQDGKLRYRMEGALTAPELEGLIDYIFFDGPPPKGAPTTQSQQQTG